MLAVSGFIYVYNNPIEKQDKRGGVYSSFLGVNKDPRTGERKFYKIAVYSPPDMAQEMREKIQKNSSFLIRYGDLDSWTGDSSSGNYFHTIKVFAKNLQMLKVIPR